MFSEMSSDWFWLAIVLSSLIFLVYKKIRINVSIFPVNCWFCNKNTTVTYSLRNSWLCPYCEQYNGFDEDGGYNKIIEEQYAVHLNKQPYQKASKLGLKEFSKSNGLCELCNLNQELKIQQLARFIPIEEGNFDQEIKEYRAQLEKSYHLCNKCDEVLKDTLEKQNLNLFASKLEQSSKFSKLDDSVSNFKRSIIVSLKIFSAFLILWTTCALLSKRIPQAKILYFFFPGDFADVQVPLVFESQKFCKELTGVGFLSYLLSTYYRRSETDVMILGLFSAFHISTWTGFLDLQLVICFVLFAFFFRALLQRHRIPKTSPKKSSETGSEGPDKSVFHEPSAKERKEKMEVKSSFDGVTDFGRVPTENFLGKSKDNFQGPNSSEAPDEIHSDMTHLNLGTKREKFMKPANFLFQNYNFKTKSADVFPLLKPPKLLRPDRSFSENSTPSVWSSSGVKPEKCELKDCYDFTLSDYSSAPYVNFNNFPCFEGNHFCNGFNYQEHDFIRFSNRLSNPSMYSYPVRDDSHFYKYTPDYQCLLNKHLEKSQNAGREDRFRWDKLKSGFYAASIFFNFLTLFFVGYYAWSGLILLELRLPSFNFFV